MNEQGVSTDRLLEVGGLYVWVWDLATNHVTRRGDYQALLGWETGAFPSEPEAFLARVHADDRPRVAAALQHTIATSGRYEYVFRVLDSGGQQRRMFARGRLLAGRDGAPDRLAGIMIDVTGQLDSVAAATDMFEVLPDAFLALDHGLVLTYVNPAAEDLLGRPRATLIGQDVDALGTVLGVPFRRGCERVLRHGAAEPEDTVLPATGTGVRVRVYPDGQGVGVFLTAEVSGVDEGGPSAAPELTPGLQRAGPAAAVSAAQERLRAVTRQQEAFADIAATVADSQSLTGTLSTTARVVVDATQAAACAIVLVEGNPPRPGVAGSFGFPQDYAQDYAAASRAGRRLPSLRAYETRQPVVIADTGQDRALDGLADQQWPGLIALPLVVHGSAMGAIKLLFPAGRDPGHSGVRFLQGVADQVAVAIHTARLSAAASEAAVVRERQRLARELHDSVTQALFSMTLLAHASSRMARRLGVDHTGELTGLLSDVEELSTSALTEMRALLFALRPQTLEGRDLIQSVEAQADLLRDRHGLQVRVDSVTWSLLGADVEEDVFRIVGEALANVVRHANATDVRVTLGHSSGQHQVVVADNGAGFDASLAHPGHLGLDTMAERAARIGGRLHVDSTPGSGTRVTLTVAPASHAATP